MYHPHLISLSFPFHHMHTPLPLINTSMFPLPHSLARDQSLDVLAHHSNHQIKQTNSLNESESQNGIREQLSSHGWVTSHSHQQGGKHHSDSDTCSSQSDGGGSHTEVLGYLDHGGGDLAVETAGLGEARGEVAGGVREDGGGLLALEGVECGCAGGDAWRGEC
jgi:hypothetical protein